MERIGVIKHRKDQNPSYRVEFDDSQDGPRWIKRIFLNAGRDSNKRVGNGLSISFIQERTSLKIAGLFVPESQRGMRWGNILMEVAFQVAEINGMPLTETASIRKPLIADLLMQYGYTPSSSATLVEILPKTDDSNAPRVHIQTPKNALNPRYPYWFTAVEGPVDPSSGNKILAIHTPYVLRNLELATLKRTETIESMDGTLRLYPNRVKRIFEK